MKDEENEPNREIKSEFCETENEGCTQYDPVSIVQNPVTSTDIPNLNIFDNTKFICDFCGKCSLCFVYECYRMLSIDAMRCNFH